VTSPEDARVATGWRGTGAERLLGRGDFIVVAEGQVQRFQAAYITPEEVRALFREKGWDQRGVCAQTPPRPAFYFIPPVRRE
jgi:DNA segregation ATPase FtsK/SpoIIIE-like protein